MSSHYHVSNMDKKISCITGPKYPSKAHWQKENNILSKTNIFSKQSNNIASVKQGVVDFTTQIFVGTHALMASKSSSHTFPQFSVLIHNIITCYLNIKINHNIPPYSSYSMAPNIHLKLSNST